MKNYFYTRESPRDEIEWVRAKEVPRDLPRPIVLITGVFDLLHVGHMRAIYAAKKKAGTLVVAVNSDEWVRKYKDPRRPIMSFIERITALKYMPVDVIVEINTEKELRDLTISLKPDLKVMGSDHLDVVHKYPWMKKMLVRVGGMHTSIIINRVLEKYGYKQTPV